MTKVTLQKYPLCVVNPKDNSVIFETVARGKNISDAVKSLSMQVNGDSRAEIFGENPPARASGTKLLVLQKAAVPSLNHLFSFENSVSHLNGVSR